MWISSVHKEGVLGSTVHLAGPMKCMLGVGLSTSATIVHSCSRSTSVRPDGPLCESYQSFPKSSIPWRSFWYEFPRGSIIVQLLGKCRRTGEFLNLLGGCGVSRSVVRNHDFRLANRRNANKNVFSVRSVTTSRCTARVLAHVNKQM